MGVFILRNQKIDQCNKGDTPKKSEGGKLKPCRLTQYCSQRVIRLHKNFDGRNIDHHSCGKAEGRRQKPGARTLRHKSHDAPDPRCKTGEQCKSKCKK